VERFLTQRPVRFLVAKGDPWLMGAVVTLDQASGRALGIERVRERLR
jgi:calcineurin-like phosphoesterase